MKISAASLLAFAGFLHESKCMYFENYVPPVSNKPTGTIDVKMNNGHDLTGTFIHVHQDAAWLHEPPTKEFDHYAIHIYSFLHGSHETAFTMTHSGYYPTAVTLAIGEHEYKAEWIKDSYFHPYNKEAAAGIHTINRVYIGIQGTREIYYASIREDLPLKQVQTGPILISQTPYGTVYKH